MERSVILPASRARPVNRVRKERRGSARLRQKRAAPRHPVSLRTMRTTSGKTNQCLNHLNQIPDPRSCCPRRNIIMLPRAAEGSLFAAMHPLDILLICSHRLHRIAAMHLGWHLQSYLPLHPCVSSPWGSAQSTFEEYRIPSSFRLATRPACHGPVCNLMNLVRSSAVGLAG